MSAGNRTRIARGFNEAMQTVCPDDVKFYLVLLLVTEAVMYGQKAVLCVVHV